MWVRDSHYIAAGITIVLFAVGIILMLYWFWPELSQNNRAMMVASSLGAGGTLILAAATLLSVRQQSATVEKIQREREKPLVIDEIVEVVEYAIDGVENNIETYEQEDRKLNWVRTDGPQPHFIAGRVSAVIKPGADSTALFRFQEEAPTLWDRLVSYEDLISEMGA